jgi:hypothetical protein
MSPRIIPLRNPRQGIPPVSAGYIEAMSLAWLCAALLKARILPTPRFNASARVGPTGTFGLACA